MSKPFTWRVEHIPKGASKSQVLTYFEREDGDDIGVDSLCPSVDDETELTATILYRPGRQQSERPSEPSIDESRAPLDLNISKDFYGFTPLYCPEGRSAEVDIIAVTGLAGHAFGSWQSKPGRQWLRDFLPKDVPNARVLTYGYDSHIVGADLSRTTIGDLSDAFIWSLLAIRRGGGSSAHHFDQRPIIFIGHSLGGLLIKKALINLTSHVVGARIPIKAIIFMATPHLGMKVEALKTVVQGQPAETLVSELKPDSPTLREMRKAFRTAAREIGVLTIFETRMTKSVVYSERAGMFVRSGPEIMMLEAHAAQSETLNETTFSANVNHSTIAKLNRGQDSSYNIVKSFIQDVLSSTTLSADVSHDRAGNYQNPSLPTIDSFRSKSGPESAGNALSSLIGNVAISDSCNGNGADSRNGLGTTKIDKSQIALLLKQAVEANNAEICAVLLKQGADPDAINLPSPANILPWTSLQYASLHGYDEVVRALLSGKARPDLGDKLAHDRPIHLAAGKGHHHVCEMLLDAGSDIEAKDINGVTSLMDAASGGYLEVCRVLLERGARIDAADKKGYTGLMMAALGGHLSICELLLGKGAKVSAKNKDGFTALHDAASRGYVEICRLLLARGAEANAKDHKEQTALMRAAWHGHLEVCRLLLTKGAEVNARGDYGLTALMIAANQGQLEVCRLLLTEGAEVNAKTKRGNTALNLAATAGHQAVCKLLRQHNALFGGEV